MEPTIIKKPTLREKLEVWIDSAPVQKAIILLITVNSISLGLETSDEIMDLAGKYLLLLDEIILILFTVEVVIRLYVHQGRFFTNSWNVFDFLIVGMSWLPSSGVFTIFRMLRVLRTLRLIKKVESLRIIIEVLLKTIPNIGWIAFLLLLVFYVFAVIVTNLFGDEFPNWFGTVGASMYTLFQIMTLESWSMGIARPVMEKFPHAYLVFIPFILVATYTTLNIFIAMVVNTMNEVHAVERKQDSLKHKKDKKDSATKEMDQLKDQLNRIEEKLNKLAEDKSKIIV